MAFWSSQTIEANLERITDHPDPDMVDCNALTLRVGSEVYVTPSLETQSPLLHTKHQLSAKEGVPIPPGQFAFLVTQEKITIPPELMAFISIKAGFKLRGLVNVSGFHVDPGWSGPLIFTVFNAGPATVHLERGLPVFLLWIADLDKESVKRKVLPGEDGIPPSIINNITGVVDSIYALEKRLKGELSTISNKQDSFNQQVSDIKERQSKILLYFGLVAVVAGILMGAGVKLISDRLFPVTAPQQLEVTSPTAARKTSPLAQQDSTPAAKNEREAR